MIKFLKDNFISLIFVILIFGYSKNNSQFTSSSSVIFSKSPFDLQGVNAKFANNIAYNNKSNTQFDIWLPVSNTPTSLVLYLHRTSFTRADNDFVFTDRSSEAPNFHSHIRFLLQNNIAFATIRYTSLTAAEEYEGIKKSMEDVRQALQYIRSRAYDFNIAKDKIILAGNSSGASESLWVVFNNCFADTSSTVTF